MNINAISVRPQLAARAPRVLSLLVACMAASALHAQAPGPAQSAAAAHGQAQAAAPATSVFAKVGDVVVTHGDFDAAFAQAARGKFYHGKPPEGEIARLQREVGQGLVDEVLLAQEAARRKIVPDAAAVQKQIDGYDARYKDSAQWRANRAQVLPGLRAKIERDDVMEQLRKQVKAIAEPGDADLRAYYDTHRDKFTSPEQVHIRMILLKVDPSSPKAKWDAAAEEGAAIARRLAAGADFEELARLHSNDDSAARGGDMGYLHRGMLPDAAQQAVDKLKAGETSPPVLLLQGVALIRLLERKEAVLNPFEAVRPRLRDLYLRDRGEQAWDAFLARLRSDNPVRFDESRFLPLASAADTAPAR